MIRRLILLLTLISTFTMQSFAQDTSAYEFQRAKINALLAERSAKFGQYDESLNARTGIFGFQTKKDIKNSNEILRQIAINDNAIFTELKVLMDYKDLLVEQVKTTSSTRSESIQHYRKTIKELQDQNQKLNSGLEKAESATGIAQLLMGLFLITTIILAYLFYKSNKQLKRYEKAGI